VTFLEFRLTFNEFVRKQYNATFAESIISNIDWTAWVQAPGDNPKGNGLNFTTVEATDFSNMADFYIDNGGDKSPDDKGKYKTAIPSLKVVFNT
jgi:hypothetical protein